MRIVGSRWSPRVHELKAFLSRGRQPYRWIDAEDRDRVLVHFPDGSTLQDPAMRDVARKLGLEVEPESRTYDLIVVGGGPAGLTAAIHAAADGLRTIVVEQEVPGGQASYSAMVENYPGFPDGLSGSELARRTILQAERFGVEVLVTRRATGLREEACKRVILDEGTELASHAVLLALGVSFRWLEAPGCPQLVGAGVYYGAAIAEAAACRDQDVYVLGGGNSAAQAALLLAQFARRVVILTLEPTLEETMSRYLIDRIRSRGNIVVRTGCTVVAVEGDDHLEDLTIQDVRTGRTERVPAQGLFIFIGATPRTDWLPDGIARDDRGFVLAGADLTCNGRGRGEWPLAREPYALETSMPGVFVAGDVRKGSVKRMASAAGEGATAIHFIYRYCRPGSGA